MVYTRYIINVEIYKRGRLVKVERVVSFGITPHIHQVATYIKIDAEERDIHVEYHKKNMYPPFDNALLAQQVKKIAPKTLILYKMQIEHELMPNIAVTDENVQVPY